MGSLTRWSASNAASHPVRGAVTVDSPADLRPFAAIVKRLQPALRGPGFAQTLAYFEQSMGLDLIPEPLRHAALDETKCVRTSCSATGTNCCGRPPMSCRQLSRDDLVAGIELMMGRKVLSFMSDHSCAAEIFVLDAAPDMNSAPSAS